MLNFPFYCRFKHGIFGKVTFAQMSIACDIQFIQVVNNCNILVFNLTHQMNWNEPACKLNSSLKINLIYRTFGTSFSVSPTSEDEDWFTLRGRLCLLLAGRRGLSPSSTDFRREETRAASLWKSGCFVLMYANSIATKFSTYKIKIWKYKKSSQG